MQKLLFFDCNCSVGRVAYPHLSDIPDVEGLLKEIKTAGIEEALGRPSTDFKNYVQKTIESGVWASVMQRRYA